MIEIRELVIRATVEDTQRDAGDRSGREVASERDGKKGLCSDSIDLILQAMNDKKER